MVKFQKHYVEANGVKAKVFYSEGQVFTKGTSDLRDCVTLYARDYSDDLGKVFAEGYVNDTDYMTDYFDHGRVRLFPGDALYDAALQRARDNKADAAARYTKRMAKRGYTV